LGVSRGDTLDLFVEALEVRFHMGSLEPFFCSAVLYDISTGTQLSEAWCFDTNPPQLSQMLGNRLVWIARQAGRGERERDFTTGDYHCCYCCCYSIVAIQHMNVD
jgi:hypothetical protein